mmetsp:Transcript_97484/g.276251  ORF Transcript_97484/g.276251 Transcript_97484/m.276251 type:complete len:374 (+) Transcript_97484:1372-2493(+)
MHTECTCDSCMCIVGDLLGGAAQSRDLVLALRLPRVQPHLVLDQCGARLREGPALVALDLIVALLDRVQGRGDRLHGGLQVLLRLAHRLQRVVQVRAAGLDELLRRGQVLLHLLLHGLHGLRRPVQHALGGRPVDGLLAPLLLGLDGLCVLLLGLHDLLSQLRLLGLHLHDAGLQLQQLGLRIGQRPRLHGLQLLDLLVYVLHGVGGSVDELLDSLLDELLARGVGRVLLQVDGALAAGQGDVTLRRVLLRLGLGAHQPRRLVLRRLLQQLYDLVELQLSECLAIFHVEAVRHRDDGGAHVLALEQVQEVLLGELAGPLLVDPLEGGLELLVGVQRVLPLQELGDLAQEGHERGLRDLLGASADVVEESGGCL